MYIENISMHISFTLTMHLFVVIQYSVHAFNPQCIYGTVEHHPLALWCVSQGKVTKSVGHNTVCPLKETESQ